MKKKRQLILFILIIILLITVSTTVFAANWGESRGNTSNLGVIDTSEPTSTAEISCNTTVASGNFTTTPAAFGPVVAIGDSGNGDIHFFNASNCALLKSYTVGADILSSPAMTNELVYFGANDGQVYALNYSTDPNPTLVWNYSTGSDVRTPVTLDRTTQILYVGSDDNQIYALNSTDGTLLWNYTTGNKVRSKGVITPGPSGPALIIGSDDNKLYILNGSNGIAILPEVVFASPIRGAVIVNNDITIIKEGTFLRGLNMSDGFNIIWSFTDGSPIKGSPAVHMNMVVFGTSKKNLFSLSLLTGAPPVWSANLGGHKPKSPVATTNGTTFFMSSGNSNKIFAYSSVGVESWSLSLQNTPVDSEIIVHEGALFIGDDGGVFYSIDNPPPEPCTTPDDDLYINNDTTLCTGTHNIVDVLNDGVIITNASDVVITCQDDTKIMGDPGNINDKGVNIFHDNVTIINCTFQTLGTAISNLVSNSSGVNLSGVIVTGSNIQIVGNNHIFTDNVFNSVFQLGSMAVGCNDTLIEDNIIGSNFAINGPAGDKSSNLTIRYNIMAVPASTVLAVQNAQDSLIAHNDIESNDNSDTLIMYGTTSGFTIYNNNFTSTSPPIDNGTSNNWQLSYEKSANIIGGTHMGGNYYSDYTGIDDGNGTAPNHNTSSDGIGDTPENYTISGSAGSIDTLPLTNTVTNCVDADADGYYADCKAGACCVAELEDCDDSNATIMPPTIKSYASDVTFCQDTYTLNPGGGTVVNVAKKEITIDCNGATIIGQGTGFALRIVLKNNVTIKNCNFINYTYLAELKTAVGLNLTNITYNVTNKTGISAMNINDSTFDSIHFNGANYALSISDMYDNYITNNIFENNLEGQNILAGGDGGEMGNLSGNIISNNIFRDNPGVGIGWFNIIYGNTIFNNTFTNISGTPISFDNVSSTIISGNTIHGEGSIKSEFTNCINTTISNNTINNSGEEGIDLDNSHNFTISNNILINIQGGNAINLIDSNDNNITGNNITNCSAATAAFVTTLTPRSYNGGKYKNCIGAGGSCIYFQYGPDNSEINQIDSDGDSIGVSGTENYTLCLIEDNNVGSNSTWFVSADDFADCNTWYTNMYIPNVGPATVNYEEFNVLVANGTTSDYIINFNASTTATGGFTAPHQVVYYEQRVYGIELETSCRNFIYNNYLANTYNADDDANITGCSNYWNTTKTSGINIAGGPFIGGNYFNDYTGSDGDGDWIGDTPWPLSYNPYVTSNMTDFLPLMNFNNTFSFSGHTYDAIGNVLSGSTVSMEVWTFWPNFQRIKTYSTTSNGTGFFNLTGISGFDGGYGYKPVVTHTNVNGTTDYVSKSLPEFPYQMIAGLPNFNFYLDEAGAINISAVNATGSPVSFYYSIKDINLGYPVKEEWNTLTTNVIEYVSLSRNYSVIIYPNMSFPINEEITNLSDYPNNHIDLQFNTSQNLVWVSGYIKTQNNSTNFTNLSIVSYVTEPGNLIFSQSAFPSNMSEWRGDGSSDVFNSTSGFYNITLIGNNNGMGVMMFVIALDSDGDGINYIQYSNVTLTDTDVTNNITVRPAAGSFNNTITVNNGMGGSINYTTLATNFSLINSTNHSITTTAFVDFTIDYTDVGGAEFHWMEDVEASESGIFSVTLLADHDVDEIEVFTESAPVKTSLSIAKVNNGTTNPPIYITVRTFEPGAIEGDIDDDDIEMRMYKSSQSCSVPKPNGALCSKGGNGQTADRFDPMIMTLGGGKVDFAMKMLSTGIEVRYIDVDLLASGPPDAMFDQAGDKSTSGSSIEEVWRFGSLGPDIYNWVLIGVPYDPSEFIEANDMTMTIDYFYDEDWNAVWTLGVNDLASVPDDYSRYAADPYDDYIDGTGVLCDPDDDDLSSGLCYKDITNNMLWFKIPHFSGIGPSISGSRSSSSSGSAGSGGSGSSWTKIRTVADCADGDDNDDDGYTDYPYDPGCEDYYDEDEENCWSEWECTDWPLCTEDGYVIRECEDLTSCDTSTQDPILSKTCVYLPQEGEPVEEEEEESGLSAITGAAVTDAIEESTGSIFKWYAKALILAGLVVLVIFSYAVFKGGGGKEVLDLFNSKEGSYNSKKTTKMMTNYIKKRARR